MHTHTDSHAGAAFLLYDQCTSIYALARQVRTHAQKYFLKREGEAPYGCRAAPAAAAAKAAKAAAAAAAKAAAAATSSQQVEERGNDEEEWCSSSCNTCSG